MIGLHFRRRAEIEEVVSAPFQPGGECELASRRVGLIDHRAALACLVDDADDAGGFYLGEVEDDVAVTADGPAGRGTIPYQS